MKNGSTAWKRLYMNYFKNDDLINGRMKVESIGSNLYNEILRVLPIFCVDLIIEKGNSILLLKRKNNPLKDTWWFPGGRIWKGETIEETAVRKAREEVGLQCTFHSIIGIEDTYFPKTREMEFDLHTFNIMVKMQPEQTSEITLDNNHCEYKWTNCIENDYPEILKKILTQLL